MLHTLHASDSKCLEASLYNTTILLEFEHKKIVITVNLLLTHPPYFDIKSPGV